jgi:alkanesulfonate monooxygenase SsuD/methylene tetrahydromethanopterin reductase-like flavin-dependent oxidoreductase (luciferase family)
MSKHILLNAFNMNCVGHINHGLWTHPRDQSTRYKALSYWVEQAQLLERGLFDGLFLADIVGVYDVYQQSVDLPLREAIQLPVNDPLLLIPAMAAATQHLGFGVTVNLTYEAPYLLARRFSTLDHLTGGRIGWNVVTGYLDSAARAMGLSQQIAHDERYDRADEFLEVAYQLWEGSWDDDAVRASRSERIYADPSRVRQIEHHGRYYDVSGYHLAEPSPQRTPAQGRDPADIKFFMGISIVTAPTEAEAREKYAEYQRYANPEAGLAHYASSSGVDFSRYGLDEPIRHGRTNAIESVLNNLTRSGQDKTVAQILRDELQLGGRYPTLVGSAEQVAQALIDWVRDTDIDGFNLARTVTPECYRDFIDLVVPQLQERGAYKTAYADGTLREKLFGAGRARLPDAHVGAASRQSTSAPLVAL